LAETAALPELLGQTELMVLQQLAQMVNLAVAEGLSVLPTIQFQGQSRPVLLAEHYLVLLGLLVH
jgi:hypothetical protein